MLKEIAENGQVVKKLKEVLADGNVQGGICALIKSYRKPLDVFGLALAWHTKPSEKP